MKKIFVFLILNTPFFLNSLFSQGIEKMVFNHGEIYYYKESTLNKDRFVLLKISPNSTDTIFKYFLPDGGFEKNPKCWDILNTTLIIMPLYTDNKKFTTLKLHNFEVDSLIDLRKKHQTALRSYQNGRYRTFSSVVPPFDLYHHMIYYQSDTLRGRLFFDFTCSKDSFLFYIYIENKKSLEKWQYTPFSRVLGYVSEKDTPRQKAWIKHHEYDVNLGGPFRTFAANNKNYLITEDGRIFLIEGDSIKLQGQIPDMRQKVLVFDKDQNRLLTTEKSIINSFKESFSIEKIYQNSKPVIDFND